MVKIDVLCHKYVPKHTIIDEDEVEAVLNKFNIGKRQLPKILQKDPAAQQIGAKEGDVIKVERQSPTAGYTIAYRLVMDKNTFI